MADPTCAADEHRNDSTVAIPDPQAGQRAAEIFRALGDANRLRMLTMLMQREMCVTEIADALQDNLPTVSQRLKLLRSERLVRSRREGKHVYYALADRHISELIANALEHAAEAGADQAASHA